MSGKIATSEAENEHQGASPRRCLAQQQGPQEACEKYNTGVEG